MGTRINRTLYCALRTKSYISLERKTCVLHNLICLLDYQDGYVLETNRAGFQAFFSHQSFSEDFPQSLGLSGLPALQQTLQEPEELLRSLPGRGFLVLLQLST